MVDEEDNERPSSTADHWQRVAHKLRDEQDRLKDKVTELKSMLNRERAAHVVIDVLVEQVADAWNDPGPFPAYHALWQERLKREWPTLGIAVEQLTLYMDGEERVDSDGP